MSEIRGSTCKGEKSLVFEQGKRRIPCVTCSGTGINWKRTYHATQSELAALREELAECNKRKAWWIDSAKSLDDRLTAAEQRNAELTQLLEATRDARDAEQYTSNELRETLSGMNALLVDLVNSPHAVVVPLELWKRINNFVDAASQTTESGASE